MDGGRGRRLGVKAEMLFSEGGNAKEVDLMEEAIDKGIPVIAFNNDDADTPNAHLAYT